MKRMKRLLAVVSGVLMIIMALLSLAPARTVFAKPEKEEETARKALEAYVDNLHFEAWPDIYAKVQFSEKPGSYTYQNNLPDATIGYILADVDNDGISEMVTAEVNKDGSFFLNVYVYNFDMEKVGLLTWIKVLGDMEPLLAWEGSGYYGLLDFFVYKRDGKNYIGVECASRSCGEDAAWINTLTSYTYEKGKLVMEKTGSLLHWTEKDLDPSNIISAVETIFGATWPDPLSLVDKVIGMETSVGVNLPGYQNIGRVLASPMVKEKAAKEYLAGGKNWENWYRIHFQMPDKRMDAGLTDQELEAINLLFQGIDADAGLFNQEVIGVMMYGGWSKSDRIRCLYRLLNDNLTLEESAGNNPGKLAPYGIHVKPGNRSDLPSQMYERKEVEELYLSLYNDELPAYDFTYKEDNGIPLMVFEGDKCYVQRTEQPEYLYHVDSVWKEGKWRIYAGGSIIYRNASTYEYKGRFYGQIYKNNSSVFGYTLETVETQEEPQFLTGLTAKASSYLEADEISAYDPSLAVDGSLSTAWNEGVDGLGKGEWIEIHTEDDKTEWITAIVLSNGYQKSDETFLYNGRPLKVRLDFSDGTTATVDNLYFDEVLTFGRAVYANWVRITILEAKGGKKYADTCISEIRLATGSDPLNPKQIYGTPHVSPDPEYMIGSDYILPESNKRLYSPSELSLFDKATLRLARNEIYARHGRKFASKDLQDYFNGKLWYHGTIEPEDFDDSVLSSIELENTKRITAAEDAK